ncbi:hypothetical protein V1478_006486 [Vespula squamosa]|uniref:Uncharacterized protein n=1 Tax=Vespula squamosa TaxID=30214 RepID=A0ABD2B7Z3_VESSQ
MQPFARSHREEVAAFGDPRANADSTLQFAFRDAFPLRELQASQPTGDGSLNDRSLKDRSLNDWSLNDWSLDHLTGTENELKQQISCKFYAQS